MTLAPPMDGSDGVEILCDGADGAQETEQGRASGLVSRGQHSKRAEEMERHECDEPRL